MDESLPKTGRLASAYEHNQDRSERVWQITPVPATLKQNFMPDFFGRLADAMRSHVRVY